MPRVDPLTAGADAKQTAMPLRDARAVLRRLDVLAATAIASDDPAILLIAEARKTVSVWSPSSAGAVRCSSARRARRCGGSAEVGGTAAADGHVGTWSLRGSCRRH